MGHWCQSKKVAMPKPRILPARMLRAVLDPCAKQIYFRRDPKVDSLRIESARSSRACFWLLHFVRYADCYVREAFQYNYDFLQVHVNGAAVYSEGKELAFLLPSYFNTNSIRGRNLELGRPVFACLIFLAFFGSKNRKAVQTTTSWTPELAQVHVTGPASPLPPRNRDQVQILQRIII